MTLANYSGLKTSIGNLLVRADATTTAEIDTFIDLFEAEVNRRIRHREMEQRSTTDAGSEYISLPTNFLELRNIKVNSNPNAVMRYETPQNFTRLRNYNSSNTQDPWFYTITGNEIRLAPIPSSSEIEIIFFEKLTPLDTTNTTNWLLADYPDTYLYGATKHGAIFTRNEKLLSFVAPMAEKLMRELELEGDNSKVASPLVVRTA